MFSISFFHLISSLVGLSSAQLSQQDILNLIAAQIGGGCVAPVVGGCASGSYCTGTNCAGDFGIIKNGAGSVSTLFVVVQTEKFK